MRAKGDGLKTLEIALRVLRNEGFRPTGGGAPARAQRKDLRFAAYRAQSRLGFPPFDSPVPILAGVLESYEIALLEGIWELGRAGDVRVLVPDYLHGPLAKLVAQLTVNRSKSCRTVNCPRVAPAKSARPCCR